MVDFVFRLVVAAQVVRSDFFPGLGWMMNRQLWEELGSRWPTGYWDDWIREPVFETLLVLCSCCVSQLNRDGQLANNSLLLSSHMVQGQRKGREVLRPEVGFFALCFSDHT